MWGGFHTTSLLKTDLLSVNLDWRGMTNHSKNETKLLFYSVTLISLRPYYSIISPSMKVKGVDGKSRLLNVFGKCCIKYTIQWQCHHSDPSAGFFYICCRDLHSWMLQPITYFMVSTNRMKYSSFTACSLEMNFYLKRIIVCLLALWDS